MTRSWRGRHYWRKGGKRGKTVTLHKASRKSIRLYTVTSHIIGLPLPRGSCRVQLALPVKICASVKIHQDSSPPAPGRCRGVPGSCRQHNSVILQMGAKATAELLLICTVVEDLLVKSKMFSSSHVHMNMIQWWKWLDNQCRQILHEKSRSSTPRPQQRAHFTTGVPLQYLMF